MKPRPAFSTVIFGRPQDATCIALTATAAITHSVFRAWFGVPVSLDDSELTRVIHKPLPCVSNDLCILTIETDI